jgi:hypothetical protein
MLEELREHVAKKIGKIARPNIVFTPELTKTRSGKIMRRLLRDVSENRALGDTTTLADPAMVEELKTARLESAPKRSSRKKNGDCGRSSRCVRGRIHPDEPTVLGVASNRRIGEGP